MILDKRNFIQTDIQNIIDKIESDHTKKINQLAIDEIQEEKRVYNEALRTIELKTLKTRYEMMSSKIINFLGSWNFIFLVIILHIIRIIINIFPSTSLFDPFPFRKLYFVLSFITLIQWPLILLSQNSSKIADEQRQQNEYLVNLKTEVEINNLHKKIDLVIYDQIQTLIETQKIQFEYLDKIHKKLEIK